MKILVPEDLIGLKIQAFSNDPRRESVDLWDIEQLMKLQGKRMDWSRVGEYCALFNQTPLCDALRDRYS